MMNERHISAGERSV